MANTYEVGDQPKITCTFTNSAGEVVDPTTVTAKYTGPSRVVTTLVYGTDAGLVKESTGVYSFYIPITVGGEYDYRVVGTGNNSAASEGHFHARPLNVA